MIEKEDKKISLLDFDNNLSFSNKLNKKTISFNRIAFVFFLFVFFSLIFSLKIFYYSSISEKQSSNNKNIQRKLFRSDKRY